MVRWECHLSINVGKKVSVTFVNYRDSIPDDFVITINSELVKRQQQTKYLAVTIDSHLRWEPWINNIVNMTIIMLLCFGKYYTYKYYSIVQVYYSIAIYGIVAWGSDRLIK